MSTMEDKQLIVCAIEMNDLLMKHKKVEQQLSCIGMYKTNNDFSPAKQASFQ